MQARKRAPGAGVTKVMEEQIFKDALLRKRTEILGTGGVKPLQASMDNNTRQGDMAVAITVNIFGQLINPLRWALLLH